jgi:hypothetical protein
MLSLGTAPMRHGLLLQRANQIIVNAANQQVCHGVLLQ